MSADLSARQFDSKRPTSNVVALELLCVALAAIEGAVCGAIFMVTAIGYHSLALRVDMAAQPLGLFVLFATASGMIYAAFAVEAFSRLLERDDRLVEILAKSFSSWTAAYGVSLLLAFAAGVVGDLSRVSIVTAFVIGAPIVIVLRSQLSRRLETRIAAGALQFQKVAVVGTREHVTQYLQRTNIWRHGRSLSGTLFIEEAMPEAGEADGQRIADFAAAAVAGGVETFIVVADSAILDSSRPLIDILRRFSVNIDLVPTSLVRFRILSVVHIGASTGLRIFSKPLRGRALVLKRALDLIGAGFGLMVLLPLLGFVALAIRIETRGPVMFRQERRGFNGSSFMIWKFRSMRVAEPGNAMVQAGRADERITKLGRFLRATSIDELPQLINVLAGDMSLVGPRPHAVGHDAELIAKLDEYAYRNRIKPGITGWAQVNGHRGETRTPEQIEARAQHDLYYIDNWSIFLDIWVILLTVFSPRTHRGVF